MKHTVNLDDEPYRLLTEIKDSLESTFSKSNYSLAVLYLIKNQPRQLKGNKKVD